MQEGEATTVQTRRLAAIMFTDIVGFSRQMGANEARTLRLLATHNQVVQQAVAEHHGTVIKVMGDAFLVDFPSVVHAVQCAQHVQAQFRSHNAEQDKAEQIQVRIGIHLGDIVQRDGDVFGDGVNIASRLQELAEPDTICISQIVYQEVEKKLALGTVMSLGRPKLKNISQRFPVYELLSEPPKGLRQTLRIQRLKLSRRVGPVVFVLVSVLLFGGLITFLFPSLSSFHIPQSEIRNQEAQPPLLPLPDKPSIVVLPFVNMSKDPEQEYFSDGLTDVLTGDLSTISSLFVIARNSAFTYKGKAVKMQDVGREMGVHYVLEGSVLKAEGQVRVTAQLIDATTGYHLWSERYDRPLQHILKLQDEIVQQIVTTLKLQLTLEEQGWVVRKHTDNLRAYDAYLRGREAYARLTKEANAQAQQLYAQAIALDPQYAEAYAWLGLSYWLEWAWRWSTDPQTLERALALEQQAVALDDALAIAHASLGEVYAQHQQYEQALVEGERAIALDPNSADSYAWQAELLNFAGRSEDALRIMTQALRLNPRAPTFYLLDLGWTYLSTGRYTEAIATLQEVSSRSPTHIAAHFNLAAGYLWQWGAQQSPAGQTLEPAETEAHRALALNDSLYWSHQFLGLIHLYQQHYEQALAEIERAVALAPTEAQNYAALAVVLSCMGRTEEALEAAAQALRLKPAVADAHLAGVGSAYAVAGHYEEARAALQRYLSRYPHILRIHLMLAVVYSELGQAAEARAEAAEVLRLNPQFSLEVHKQRMPIRDPAVLERHLAALRKAGLK